MIINVMACVFCRFPVSAAAVKVLLSLPRTESNPYIIAGADAREAMAQIMDSDAR